MSVSRRQFVLAIPALGLTAAAFPKRILSAQAMQTFNGPMANAQEVYRPVALAPKPNATASMTAAQRDELEHQIHCQCGCVLDVYTCRTTDFSCSVSPAMHADVMGLVSGGYAASEILAAFRTVYGEKVLMAPVKSGFNIVGYTMPFIALATGAVLVGVLIRRWKGRSLVASTPSGVAHVSATSEELAQLDAAVRNDA
ncbi:MAG TPA: cytochrome c-type biogenesis protein CcmH [Gemmatimonadaceae bacterium]|nr:cytochrome c-type biogenesis protein CcmH [Gemmatimonadaceae bacterium]